MNRLTPLGLTSLCLLHYTSLALFVSSHTDAIHIGAMEIDGSRMTLPR